VVSTRSISNEQGLILTASRRVANGNNVSLPIELNAQYTKNIKKKACDQKRILDSGQDVRILRKAMCAFTSLQHVQILRLIEPLEIEVPKPFLNLEWSPACSHATKTMGEALLVASSPFSGFSGSMINPQSVLVVQEKIPDTLSSLASRLTCLELHFDGGPELMTSLMELSSLARNVFLAATNLQALHVGFPARAPLDLRLKDMLHNVCWKNLRAFGVQAWRLQADEITDVVRRHKQTLRGLRLRDVQLKDGSRWKDVLSVLRTEMKQLEWVSLRRIDYAAHFDDLWGGSMEVGDDLPAIDSDSDIDDEEPEVPMHFSGGEGDTSEDEDPREDSDEEVGQGTDADDFNFLADTPVSLPFCTCADSSWPTSAEDLGDNGKSVTYQQSKMWERWVCGKCPEHT